MKKLFHSIDKGWFKINNKYNKKAFYTHLLNTYINYEDQSVFNAVFSIPMDIYFLLRLFINFDKSKMLRGPIGCRGEEYAEMKNIIFYGGSYHTGIYIDFLKQHFQTEPKLLIDHRSNDNQCIVFDSPFDFFSFQ